jgi:hypothetical protein
MNGDDAACWAKFIQDDLLSARGWLSRGPDETVSRGYLTERIAEDEAILARLYAHQSAAGPIGPAAGSSSIG